MSLKSLILSGTSTGSPTSLRAQLTGQSAGTMVLNLCSMAFAFATSVVLSRSLGARGYGVYVYALAWPAVLAILAQMGTGHLLVRNIAVYSAQERWGLVRGLLQHAQWVVLRASAALVVGAGAVAWLFVGREQPMLRRSLFVALLLVPILALIAQREAVLRGFRRILLGRLSETVVQPTTLLVLLGVFSVVSPRHLEPVDAMVATVAAAAVALALGSMTARRVTPSQVRSARAQKSEVATWTRSARWLVAINALQVVNLQMSVLFLGAIDSVDATAVFSVALRWAGIVAFLQTAATFPLAPAVAHLHAVGAGSGLQRLVSKAALGVLLLSAPAIVGLLLFGEHALGLFGPQFRTGTNALSILVIGETVNIASGFVGVILVSTGHERTLFIAAGWLTALRVVVSAALIEVFGLVGAAAAQAGGLALQNIVLAVLVWRKAGVYAPGIAAGRFQRRAAAASARHRT